MGSDLHQDKWISATPAEAIVMLLIVVALAIWDAATAALMNKETPR